MTRNPSVRKMHYRFASGWELSYWSDPTDNTDVTSPIRKPEDLSRDPDGSLFDTDVAVFIPRDRVTAFDTTNVRRED